MTSFAVLVAFFLISVSATPLNPSPSVKPNFSAFPGYEKDRSVRAKLVKDFYTRYIDAYESEYMASHGLKQNPFPADLKDRLIRGVDEWYSSKAPLKPVDTGFLLRSVRSPMDRARELVDKNEVTNSVFSKLDSIDAHLARIEAELKATQPLTRTEQKEEPFGWTDRRVLLGAVGLSILLALFLIFRRPT